MNSFFIAKSFLSTNKLKKEVLMQVGKSTEIISQTHSQFLIGPFRQLELPLLSANVELILKNQSNTADRPLLRLQGHQNYRRTINVLHFVLSAWYNLFYTDLRITTYSADLPNTSCNPELNVSLKWRIEGRPRFSYFSSSLATKKDPSKVLLVGYSHFEFEETRGLLRRHVVDRIVPPLRNKVLWWFLMLRNGSGNGFPIIPKPTIVPSQRSKDEK